MKSVTLVRHVKSDWSNLVSDFDRPVREDRKDDAILIAKEITRKGALPQYIISSPAIRALQTARLLCTQWYYPAENIFTDRALYECAARDIMDVIKAIDDEYDNIVIVCHNPAISDFVNQYSTTYLDNVPTTGAVNISFEVDHWKSIHLKGKLNWILRPKEIRGESRKVK
jgi:phosphohistidine phosphatase